MFAFKFLKIMQGLEDETLNKGKGGSAPAPTPTQTALEQAQVKEMETLNKQEEARVAAMKRSRRGRSSLLGGTELGMEDTNNVLGA